MAYLGSYSSKDLTKPAPPKNKAERDTAAIMNRRKKDAPQGTPFNGGKSVSSQAGTPVSNPVPNSATPYSSGVPAPFGTPDGMISADTGEGFKSRFGEFVGDVAKGAGAFSGLVPNPELVAQTQNAQSSVGTDVGALLGTGFALGGGEFVDWIAGLRAARNAAPVVNAVSKSFTIGKLSETTTTVAGTTIATNTATIAKTSSWLGKLAQTAKNPQAVAGALMAAVGSYPFSGFIQEEALQTASFASKTAIENGDLVGAQEAIDFQNEMLNPTFADKVIASVPYVNVVAELKDFFKASRLKVAIDQKVIDDMRTQQESGESDEQMYARIAEERALTTERERQADAEYYANIERLRQEAKAAERAADEAYWSKIAADRESAQAKKDEETADYWTDYYKRLAETKTTTTSSSSGGSSYEPPSKLGFGLL